MCPWAGGPGGPKGCAGGSGAAALSPGAASSRARVTPALRPFPPVASGGHPPGLAGAAAAAWGASVPRLAAARSSRLAPSNGRVQVPASLGPLCRALDVLRRSPGPPAAPDTGRVCPLTPTLPPQAAGDMPTTPKHPKDTRENVFPAATAPAAPESTPADAPPRPNDGHTKPRPASATASTPDPAKDPGPPRPHRPEAAPSTSSLRPGESVPSTQGPQQARSPRQACRCTEMWAPPVQ